MTRRPLIRLLFAAMLGAVCALALVGALYISNGSLGFAGTTAATTFGWLIPLLVGLLAALLGVGLMAGHRVHGGQRSFVHRSNCAVCGESIFHNWRLCPHCGARLAADSQKRD